MLKDFLLLLVVLVFFGPLMAALIWGTWGMVGAACVWLFVMFFVLGEDWGK
jgi:hypothetical protein